MIQPANPSVHLDTSFLILGLVPGSPESEQLHKWLGTGQTLVMSTLAWGELFCGPLEDDVVGLVERIVRRLVPVRREEAEEAARLFNQTGRRRGSLPDCVIAATAILAAAPLASSDRSDFQRFVASGLDLVG